MIIYTGNDDAGEYDDPPFPTKGYADVSLAASASSASYSRLEELIKDHRLADPPLSNSFLVGFATSPARELVLLLKECTKAIFGE